MNQRVAEVIAERMSRVGKTTYYVVEDVNEGPPPPGNCYYTEELSAYPGCRLLAEFWKGVRL